MQTWKDGYISRSRGPCRLGRMGISLDPVGHVDLEGLGISLDPVGHVDLEGWVYL